MLIELARGFLYVLCKYVDPDKNYVVFFVNQVGVFFVHWLSPFTLRKSKRSRGVHLPVSCDVISFGDYF